MADERSKTPIVFKKFRFLGQRWRFLKNDIQQEMFPGFKRVCVERMNLNTSFMNHDNTTFMRDIGSDHSDQLKSDVNLPPRNKNDKNRIIQRTELDFLPPEAISEQDRLLVQLRNAQLFHRNNMYPAEVSVEETVTVGSPRAAVSVPISPRSLTTSLDIGKTTYTNDFRDTEGLSVIPRRPTSGNISGNRRPTPIKREIADKYMKNTNTKKIYSKKNVFDLHDLEIGRCFKDYSVEKGHRIPICLCETGPDKGGGLPKSNIAVSPAKERKVFNSQDILSMNVVPIVPTAAALFPSRPKFKRSASLLTPKKNP